jgi:hypothetical protein
MPPYALFARLGIRVIIVLAVHLGILSLLPRQLLAAPASISYQPTALSAWMLPLVTSAMLAGQDPYVTPVLLASLGMTAIRVSLDTRVSAAMPVGVISLWKIPCVMPARPSSLFSARPAMMPRPVLPA